MITTTKINNIRTLYEYSEYVNETYIRNDSNIAFLTIALSGEIGEVCNKIKVIMQNNSEYNVDEILYEFGDVLWYLTALANEFGYSLNEVVDANTEKLNKRYNIRSTYSE